MAAAVSLVAGFRTGHVRAGPLLRLAGWWTAGAASASAAALLVLLPVIVGDSGEEFRDRVKAAHRRSGAC